MATKVTKKTTSVKVEKKMMICKNGCSNKPKAMSKFYESNLEEYKVYGGYVPICKECLRKMAVDTTLNTVTMDSIKSVLKRVDKPFVEDVFVAVKNKKDKNGKNITNDKILGDYIKTLNCYPKYRGLVYSDTIDIKIEQEKIMNSKVEEATELQVTDDMKLFWGKGLNNEEYFDLQARFDKFMDGEEDPYNLDYKKELDYKKLVIWEFQLSKIQYDLDKIKEASQLQKNIADLSTDLGIKAIQKKEDNSNKGAYDLFIKKIETTKPVFDWERDLGHKDEVKELLQLYFYAYLMDANNQKTEFTPKLYEELNNYTPDMTSLFDSDDEDGDYNG